MTVYVVTYNSWYEFGQVEKVFLSLETAKAFVEERINGDFVSIETKLGDWIYKSEPGQCDYSIEKFEVKK